MLFNIKHNKLNTESSWFGTITKINPLLLKIIANGKSTSKQTAKFPQSFAQMCLQWSCCSQFLLHLKGTNDIFTKVKTSR